MLLLRGIFFTTVAVFSLFPVKCIIEQDYISTKLVISPGLPCPYTEDAEPCLTLKEFSEDVSQYSHDSNGSFVLKLLPGNHTLTSQINVQNIPYLKILSYHNVTAETAAVTIQCSDLGSFMLINITMVHIAQLTFNGCGARNKSAVFNIVSSNFNIKDCRIYNSKGTVIDAHFCDISIYKCEFVSSYYGVIKAVQCRVSDNASFYSNTSQSEIVLYSNGSDLDCRKCKFDSNGCIFYVSNTTVVLHLSELTNNEASVCHPRSHYNSIFHAHNSTIKLESSSIKGNTVTSTSGAIVYIWQRFISLYNTSILHNTAANFGRILYANKVTLRSDNNTIIMENYGRISTVYLKGSTVNISGKFLFIGNSGTFLIKNSIVQFFSKAVFQNCRGLNATSTFKKSERRGGALTSINSKIWFFGLVLFHNEDVGGALCAMHGSRVFVNKSILMVKNRAKVSGGGIYLYISNFVCGGHCNFSENYVLEGKGGGIYATDSKITLGNESVTQCNVYIIPTNSFVNVSLILRHNSAINGGGMYLGENSNLIVPSNNNYRLIFEYNNAIKDGAAMYVDDDTYHATCCESNNLHQCFLQTSSVSKYDNHDLQDSQIQVIGNSTNLITTIFGGLFHQCYVFNIPSEKMGIDYLKAVTRDQDIIRMITSKAVQVYFCNESEVMEHTRTWTEIIMVQKGGSFTVKIVAVDQVNRSVKASIHSYLHFSGSSLGGEQIYQNIEANCSILTFNAYSLSSNETLYISPKSQCKNKGNKLNKVLKVYIKFKQCTCPVGFYIDKHTHRSCKCDCDPKIAPYQQECNLFTVVRKNKGWVNYSKDTGFLLHPFCPYDFCLPPDTAVSINLNVQNGSDAQCDFNRTGLLCGRCKPGFSLSLSSSRCLECPEINWPWALLIIVVNIIAGIVLVIVILMLNLTINFGTLNGLVFYANILAADSSLFLSLAKSNFLTVFIAWLNLDLGFDVCYFKGIDAYSKAWLNISFPTYVITVLLLIILISKYSSKFGDFIGRWNPVATLATLLLLSYTKLLRAIITALSFTIITFPTGRQEIVWLQDASVKFFGLKHFPLGLLAIVIIIVGFIYTVLLFSWQWILRLPNRRVFRWVRNTRLNLFIEANLAPYKAKYRYWYGLLLLVRMALYLGIATEESHESVTIVLAIGLIAASILLLRTFLGNNIYRNRLIGYVNSSFYYNLLALSLARLYCQDSASCQKRSSIISIALAFILFAFILSYHVLCALLEIRQFRHLISSIEQMLNLRKLKIRLIDDPRFKNNIQESEMQEAGVVIIPTSTEVTLSPRKDSSDDDKRSGKSANKNSADDEHCRVKSEETGMNDSFDNENVCKQKTNNKKGKRWTNSNTLREPLLQD